MELFTTDVKLMLIVPVEEARGREQFGQGDVLATGRRPDVEIAQHLRAVDGHIKDPRSGGVEDVLNEIQPHDIASTGRQLGDGVGEVAVASVLQHALRWRVGHATGVDGCFGACRTPYRR